MPEQPMNVLVIVTDEQRIDELGAYGTTPCKTPNLDRLAAESLLFGNAYTSCPLCSPARATLLTGQYPHAHGITCNTSDTGCCVQELHDNSSLLPRVLQRNGYACGFNGKWHLGTSQGQMYGSRRKEAVPSDFGFEGLDFPGHGGIGMGYPQYKDYLAKHGYCADLDIKTDMAPLLYGTWQGNGDEGVPHFITSETIDLLETFRKRGQPFYMQHNFWGPHQPYFVPDTFRRMYDGVAIPMRESFNYEMEPGSPQRLRQLPGPNRTDWAKWEELIRHKYAFMTYIDHEIGRLLEHLDHSGLRENTMVLFTTDHGDNLGGHGGLLDKGFVHFEDTHRIPLLLRHRGCSSGRRDDFVSLVDIYPTILDAVGAACPKHRHGRSLLQESIAARDSVVVEFHGLSSVTLSMRTIRSGNYKYGWSACSGDELYDLFDDPHEMRNRIGDESYQALVGGLRRKLAAWMKETGDPVLWQFSRLFNL